MKKLLLKRFIFLFVFFDIAIGITYWLISSNLPTQNQSSELSKTDLENIKTVGLDETYDLNDLKLTEYSTIIEGANYIRDYSIDDGENYIIEDNQDVVIPYYQIDGLKDESIEISINYILKNDVENKVNEILDDENFSSDLYIGDINYSNFANTLSIYYYIFYIDKNDEYITINISENFDLNTGNRINLDDVILNTANMRQFLSQKLYAAVVSTISDIDLEDEDWLTYKISNYNDIEEEIALLIYNFQNENDINFVFDEKGIYFLDYECNILYRDCLDYVTIYDKYSQDYIFDGTYSTLKNIPTLVSRTYGEYQIIEEADNYLLDITLISDFDENAIAGETSPTTEFVDSQIKSMKETAKENPDTFYIFNCYYEVNSYDSYESYIYENYYELKTTKTVYENTLKEEILKIQRNYEEVEYEPYMYGNLFLAYLDENKYNITSIWQRYFYNPSTSEIYLDNDDDNYEYEEDSGITYDEDDTLEDDYDYDYEEDDTEIFYEDDTNTEEDDTEIIDDEYLVDDD